MGSLPNLHALSAVLEQERPLSQAAVVHTTSNFRSTISHHVHHPQPHVKHHHRVHQTRSGGHQHGACWDDFMLEQMAAYSPVSSRSTRSTAHSYHNTHFTSSSTRRRDSMSSSGGASSVRRLIAVVRSTPSRLGPVYSRRVLLRNFAALCLGHATVTAALLPLLALQSSISAWWWPRASSPGFSSGLSGSLLLCTLFAVAALSSLLAPTLVQRIGANCTLIFGYAQSCLFFGLHLYPTAVTLVPGYILMGMWLGPLASARVTFLMTLASKLSYVITEEEDDDVEDGGRREAVVQRLARGLQTAQDFGLVLGSIAAALLLWYTLPTPGVDSLPSDTTVLDVMFREDDSGDRICGSSACPVSTPYLPASPSYSSALGRGNGSNSTTGTLDGGGQDLSLEAAVPCKTSAMLASVFLGCSVMALALTAAFLDRIRLFVYQDPLERPTGVAALRAVRDAFRDPRLQLAAPLSVFIGLEQGFLYADFSKSYVVCALRVPNVSLVFLSLGLLQSVAAFTLSLLLQHIRRCLAIVVGFVFHACLLLVLLLWKPSGDDPALFYVISAAWGVCNAIWETLSFTFIVNVYPDTWQAPYAHCYFFRCLGLALAFGLHGAVCNWIKLYSLAGALVLAVAPYTWLEMKLDARRRNKTDLATL